jgi:hypothetical protein
MSVAPGARVVIRDAEWLVRLVDRSSRGDALTVVGLSELVRDKEAVFLSDVEPSIELLDPEDTMLVPSPTRISSIRTIPKRRSAGPRRGRRG